MVYYVFLDTNIYEKSNFSFQNRSFTKLKELTKSKKVILLYNNVIYGEVRKHIVQYIEAAVKKYNQAIENKNFAPFRNVEKWSERLSRLEKEDMINSQLMAWDDYLNECGAIKIPTKNIDVDVILNKYFKGILPFEEKKPNEFKDAITVESIYDYFEKMRHNEYTKEMFVVAQDNGVKKCFIQDKGISTFSDLDKFLNYVILQTEHLARIINKKLNRELIDLYISDRIKEQIYLTKCVVEGCFDFDIIDVEYLGYKSGYIDIINNALTEMTLEISAKICINYVERDEEKSYYNEEERSYLFDVFNEYEEMHEITCEAVLGLDIDEKAIKETVDKYNGLIEEADKLILKNTITLQEIWIPEGTVISMGDNTKIDRKIVKNIIDGWEVGEEFVGTPCCQCGVIISYENNANNGLCLECSLD